MNMLNLHFLHLIFLFDFEQFLYLAYFHMHYNLHFHNQYNPHFLHFHLVHIQNKFYFCLLQIYFHFALHYNYYHYYYHYQYHCNYNSYCCNNSIHIEFFLILAIITLLSFYLFAIKSNLLIFELVLY